MSEITPFIHLGVHSEYSLVDSVIRIPALMQQLQQLGQPAVALTDHCNLFAMVKFYKAAIKAGIKPIIGAEIYVNDCLESSRPVGRVRLLCQDYSGYQNLCRLLSFAYAQSALKEKQITHEQLFTHNAGLLICAGQFSDIGQVLLHKQQERTTQLLGNYLHHFNDRLLFEITRIGLQRENEFLHTLSPYANAQKIPVIASNNVRFISTDEFAAHEIRVCINQGRVLDDKRRPRDYTKQQYLRSSEEMYSLFEDIPHVLQNTIHVAERCNLELTFGNYVLPAYPTGGDTSEADYLARQAEQGLEERLAQHGVAAGKQLDDYQQRLQHELTVINQMGFPGYFLIVADFIQWAKKHAIPVGPGRGSGAGSVVAWAMRITDLDPLRYDLLFERFLNPERISMPDFDIDFCMNQRDEVIQYVADTYGHESVSQIITFGKMNAKAVIRDVGRVMGYLYGQVDAIAKLIPPDLNMTLTKAMEDEPELKQRYNEIEDERILIDRALQLEGVARNAGKHAGGVVIAPGPLSDYTALYNEPDGAPVTQLDKDDVESIGLVKFDFLGLRTLTVLDWALDNINARRATEGQDNLDLATLPLDDKATYKLLQACHTTAVFQLESRGMKDLVRRLQPDNFEDIVALVALFRPGPLNSGMVDDYIARKNGEAPVVYPHPLLEPILQPTRGVIVYQEQVMQIVQEMAGYSLGAADLLRRAMGKKKVEEMERHRPIFVEGAGEKDIDAALANRVFDQMETFAEYGFNKSHSAAYALLSYQTAYLKAHYPAEFMAAVLSTDMEDSDKIAHLVEDCKQLGLTILPPDVMASGYRFSVSDEAIRFGLGAIKGVGQSAIENIIDARGSGKDFDSLTDFCCRLDLRKVNRRTLEALNCAGALRCFNDNQAECEALMESAMQAAEQVQNDRESGQAGLFGAQAETPAQQFKTRHATVSAWTEQQRLKAERKVIGLYLTGHPLDEVRDEISQFISGPLHKLPELVPPDSKQSIKDKVICAQVLMQRRRPGRGAFIAVHDGNARMEVVVYEEVYARSLELLGNDEIVVICGDLGNDSFSGGVRIIARDVLSLNEARARFARAVHLKLQTPQAETVQHLKACLQPYRSGKTPVIVDFETAGKNQTAGARIQLGDAWNVKASAELLAAVNGIADVNARLIY